MIRVTFALLFGSVLLLEAQPPPLAMAQTAAQLAALTSSLLPRRSIVSLELQNLTNFPAPEWSSFRGLLQDEFHKAGLETAGVDSRTASPESRVRVTLSEDTRGLLLVAEVFSGDNRQIAMLPWNLPSAAPPKPRITISNKLLWAQTEPILDLAMVDSDSVLLILSTNQVASYRLLGDKWTPSAATSLLLPRPLTRDPRGRLNAAADGFRAYLPTATCQGTWKPDIKLACVNGTETWPDTQARFVADRNTLQSDAMKVPFFSSANGTSTNGLFATADGRVEDRTGQPVIGAEAWGSDIAGAVDPCGSGIAVIATSASADREEIRVYELANGQATPASDALSLPGPVTGLWPAESRGQATLVVRNLLTGQYEASRLALACTE
jgi:hypothetical protein